MDEFSWALCSDHIFRHNKVELHKMSLPNETSLQEGDIIGVAFDHIQLKFFVNGEEIDYSITNIKGTTYPALYGKSLVCVIICCYSGFAVDDGAILDIVLDQFSFSPPSGFDKIMLEQSLL